LLTIRCRRLVRNVFRRPLLIAAAIMAITLLLFARERIWPPRPIRDREFYNVGLRRVHAVAFSPDGQVLAAGTGHGDDTPFPEGRLFAWDRRTGRNLAPAAAHGWINSLAFTPDGSLLAAATGGFFDSYQRKGGEQEMSRRWCTGVGEVVLWNTRPWTEKRVVRLPGAGLSVAFSSDGARLAALSAVRRPGLPDTTEANVWDLPSGKLLRNISTQDDLAPPIGYAPLQLLTFSPDSKQLAIPRGGPEGEPAEIEIWNCASWERTASLAVGESPVRHVSFTSDGTRLIVCATGVTVWNTDSWKLKERYRPWGQSCPVPGHDDLYFVGCYIARFGDSVREVATFSFPPYDGVTSLTTSRDASLLAIGDPHGMVFVWDMPRGLRSSSPNRVKKP
jgi:WD40 repeat protein